MIQNTHYIEWLTQNKTHELQVAEIMRHWQSRYELGTAVVLSNTPQTTLKLVQKQWQKLTRQMQKQRETNSAAGDILQTTRTISRMQRIKFTTEDPAENPDANLYVLSFEALTTLPAHCFTLYSTNKLPAITQLKLMPADSLVVAYQEKAELSGIYNKSVLEERVLTEEAILIKWLSRHSIDLGQLPHSIEHANEALDVLLSSNNLQTEFLNFTKQYLHLVQLAQPLMLSAAHQERLKALEQLEHHVRVLSPAFLSDHIIDSQNDDSFLLRELSTKKILTLESLKEFIAQQYELGHRHLAAALEQQAGFIRI